MIYFFTVSFSYKQPGETNEVYIMKSNFTFFLLLLLPLSFFSCSNGEQGEGETLVKINNYNLTLLEFQQKLALELNLDEDLKLTPEVKTAFLEQLIQEELLIQEARRLKLDRKEKFTRAIERYWKSTLIRDLLERKSEEISQTIVIPQTEIEAFYEQLKKESETPPPLAEIQDEIITELKEKKMSEKLKEWLTRVEKKADITIDQKLLLKD